MIAASIGEVEREEFHAECREVQVPHDPDGVHGTVVKRQWYWPCRKKGKGDR